MKVLAPLRGRPGVEAEVSTKEPFSPDVLVDLAHRAAELVLTQRVSSVVMEESDAPEAG